MLVKEGFLVINEKKEIKMVNTTMILIAVSRMADHRRRGKRNTEIATEGIVGTSTS